MNLRTRETSRRASYKWLAFAAIAIGTFTSVADHGSIIVALPSIAQNFNTDLPTAQWVLIGYSLTVSALLLPMGRLSDIIGLKKVYLAGFAIFIIGAFLAGSSSSITEVIGFKVLQGVGAAMTQGTGMAMTLSTFEDNERGKALGLHLSLVGAGNVVGPAVGGFIVGFLGWQWVFYVNVFLGFLAIVPAAIILDGKLYSSSSRGSNGFDWPGAALSSGLLVLFLMGVTNAPKFGWTSPLIVAAFVAFVIFLALFIWWELRTSQPLFDVRMFGNRAFTLGTSAVFLAFIGQSSVRFLMPFYLQFVNGYSPSQIGVILIPAAFMMIIMGPISGRLSDRFGPRILTSGGLAISIIAMITLSRLEQGSALWIAMTGIILQSLGMGLFYAPNNSSLLSTIDKGKFGVMSGFLNLVRNSANITGIALITAIVTMVMAFYGQPPNLAAVSEVGGQAVINSFTSGMKVGYLSLSSLVVLGMVLSFMRSNKAHTEAESDSISAEPKAAD